MYYQYCVTIWMGFGPVPGLYVLSAYHIAGPVELCDNPSDVIGPGAAKNLTN